MSSAPAKLGTAARPGFRRALLRWFDTCQRPLPWRTSREPYRVWVSEIMLQQTRVTAVLEHYARFFESFPTVASLAQAPLHKVLAVWSGLGYYRRARMLHAAARKIVGEFEGRFPGDAAGWETLHGIGRYTAAAIASICFGEHCPVVDGNVRRVIHRLRGHPAGSSSRNGDETLALTEVWNFAGALLSRSRPGDFNEAMMELGATVCVPKTPQCAVCPVHRWCLTGSSRQSLEPQNPERQFAVNGSQPRNKVELSCALIFNGDRIWLVRRSLNESVMPGMWELPAADSHAIPARIRINAEDKPAFLVRHAIMNTDYLVRVYRFNLRGGVGSEAGAEGKWFEHAHAKRLPLTGLARKILQRSGLLAAQSAALAAAAKRRPQRSNSLAVRTEET